MTYRSGNRYILVLEDDTEYNLYDETFKRLEDSSTIEVDVIERSFQAGAEFPGVQRDQSKEITFQYNLDRREESLYRARENELRRLFRATRKIKDMKNGIQTDVLLREHVITYDDGGFNLGSVNNVVFIQLKPFWEDIDPFVEGDTGAISNQIITIDNTGYIETPPVILLQAMEQVTKFSIVLLQNNQGIVVRDEQFGTSGLNTYIIDNSAGTVELNQIDRNNKVRPGTGPFNLLVGKNDIEINSTGQMITQIQWRRRYYI